MEHTNNSNAQKVGSDEMKQVFLSNAIADIATYIQLADTKVSILMGSLIALVVGILACHEPISQLLSNIKPCSWVGISIVVFFLLYLLSTIGVFCLAF